MSKRKWVFTLNNYNDEDIKQLENCVNSKLLDYVVAGKEIAPTTNMPHLQGYLEVNKRITLNSLKKKLGLSNSVFLDKMKTNTAACIKYCKKDNDYIEFGACSEPGKRNDIHLMYEMVKDGKSPYEIQESLPGQYSKYYKAIDRMRTNIKDNSNRIELRKQFSGTKLRIWQQKILDRLLVQDDRKVLWIYDEDGGMGKTYFAKYLLANYDAFYVMNGKNADIAYAYNYEDIIVFDYTRSLEDYVNYSIIEQFKNGLIFSSKYESQTKKFKSKKVLCLSNFLPIESKLSKDRWDIVDLGDFDGC